LGRFDALFGQKYGIPIKFMGGSKKNNRAAGQKYGTAFGSLRRRF
jgi:hypothetical protein